MTKLCKLFDRRTLSLGRAKAVTLGQPVGSIAEEGAGFYL